MSGDLAHIRGTLSPQPLARAGGVGNVAALTFDDGPTVGATDAVLDFLAEHAIRAVFCVVGESITAEGAPDLLQRIVDEGHLLGNHTTSFADLGSWSAGDIAADLEQNLRIIRGALRDPDAAVPYYRAPNGNWGVSPDVAVRLGMQPLAVVNTIDDWRTQNAEELTVNLRAAMKPGEVVLLHDGGGDRSGTVRALRTVVSERLTQGWRFTLPAGA